MQDGDRRRLAQVNSDGGLACPGSTPAARRLLAAGLVLGLSVAAAQAVEAVADGTQADARRLVEDGNDAGAPACSICHGEQGQGSPEAGYPRLAGLAAAYIRHELDSFADGSRANEIMMPAAKALSPSERGVLAAYYAGQSAPANTAIPAVEKPDAQTLARGAALAATGDWALGLPGCGQCHGPAGQGVGAVFPGLTGQPADYLSGQIAAWKAGARRNDPLGLMAGIAVKLN